MNDQIATNFLSTVRQYFDMQFHPAESGQTPSANAMTSWSDYQVDAVQRGVLFLDLLRQRGN